MTSSYYMFKEFMAEQLKTIPISNNTVSRQITDISEDLHEQLMKKLKTATLLFKLTKLLIFTGTHI